MTTSTPMPAAEEQVAPASSLPSHRRSWVAALLALLCNGLGHVYNGRTLAGVGVHALWLVAAVGLLGAMRIGVAVAIAAGGVALGVWGAQAVLAARGAHTASRTPRGWLSRPFGLVVFYVLTSLVSMGVSAVLKPIAVRTFVQSSRSMMPTVWQGDWVVTIPGGPVERGSVVVHRAPSSAPSSLPLMKRVVAMGGDTVEVRDGFITVSGERVERKPIPGPCTVQSRSADGTLSNAPCEDFVESLAGRAYHSYCTPSIPCGDGASRQVPAGHVFVLGDYRDHSADSRVYGPVPESDVLGRVSYVYFSVGPAGVRWDRIGHAVR